MKNSRNKNNSSSYQGSPTSIPTSFYIVNGHHPSHKVLVYCVIFKKDLYTISIIIINIYNYSAGMKERCRDGCRTSLLRAGVVLVPAIFHTSPSLHHHSFHGNNFFHFEK